MSSIPTRLVERSELNSKFNSGGYWERVLSGDLVASIKRNKHRQYPTESLPYCTHSQIVNYYDHSGNRLAVVHQYILPDGSIGGSGKPEPKRLWVDGVSWYVRDAPVRG